MNPNIQRMIDTKPVHDYMFSFKNMWGGFYSVMYIQAYHSIYSSVDNAVNINIPMPILTQI